MHTMSRHLDLKILNASQKAKLNSPTNRTTFTATRIGKTDIILDPQSRKILKLR